jgi:cytidyltransferase-like protein
MMIVVYIPGVWDLLHVGHITVLERAAALGDVLVVGVPTDSVVLQDKGSLPIIPLDDRILMLKSLWCVDVAVPYYRLDFLTHLSTIRPDILAVGETWGNERRHQTAEAWIETHGRRFVKLPYTLGESATAIKERCRATKKGW